MKDLNKEYKIYAADVEATGLLHHLVEQGEKAKLHNLCVMDIEDCNMTTFHTDTEEQRKDIQALLDQPTIFIMHNGICYDKNALKHFGYDVSKAIFVDTLALSWYLDLNRDKHGLENYGEEFGVPKPAIVDWESLTQQDYDHRVQEDVKIQYRTYKKLKSMFEELYGEMTDYEFCTHKVVKYLNFKMEQLEEQQNTKFKVDVPHTKKVVEELEQEIEHKTEQLKASMPKVPEYTKHTRPAKPFKKDGTLSSHGEKWKSLCEEAEVDFDYEGEIKKVKQYNEPNPASSSQVKDWLFSLGWIPETFKYVKDDSGNERSTPQVYVQGSGGQVCPSIEKLAEEHEELQHLVGLGVLSHRKSCVKGFLDSLVFGEFVEASANGFTNTLRLKHRKPCVNLPSSRVVYGEAVRSCLVAREGMLLGGADLSSLENRIKFNLQLPYDREYVLSQMSSDFDPHLEIAQEGGLLKQHEVWFYKIVKGSFPRENYPKDSALDEMLNYPTDLQKTLVKHISEVRGKGKETNYSCQYGAGAATVARTAGVPLSVGKALVKAYKKVNWSIEKIAQSQTTKKVSHGNYQLNPFNGMWYHLKTDKDRFSTLVQGTGAYVLDLWLGFQFNLRNKPDYDFDEDGVKLLATFHDEQVVEFKEIHKDQVQQLMKDSLNKVNERFKLEIPFDCDVQFGVTYADIH
jgi:DNA polymerase I-like protein with 3'-5' exonuclease and polymerase domains